MSHDVFTISSASRFELMPAYLRVAALAVAAYDWLWTLPTEYDIYRRESSLLHIGRPCLMFILIRYISMITIIASNVAFFKLGIPAEVCSRLMIFSPIMKATQSCMSQIIMGVRTYGISRQTPWVFWTLLTAFTMSAVLEYWSNLYKRVPIQSPYFNCTSGNADGFKIAWIHYLACMLFDTLCLSIATGYLYSQSRNDYSTRGIQRLAQRLLSEGLAYFFVLTAANTLNLVLYRTAQISDQSAGASLSYSLTWIMSQRILIQLHNLRRRQYPTLSTIQTTSVLPVQERRHSSEDAVEGEIGFSNSFITLDIKPSLSRQSLSQV